ncbi:MAG: RNA 2',3'-cyclic phosphodiesterase [Candidatus Omnitrophica bacterium]|nr:RNA 2',3'-cyclic phosphodiesterase [Candidatus Omnitrophota bacterium]
MSEKIRSFIAIALPPEIKNYLATLISDLKKTAADVKWVRPENIHLTLKFLGEQEKETLKKIEQILDALTKDFVDYEIEISQVGGFPKLEYPRVIWVGISEGDKETKALAKAVDEKINKVGIPKEERAFSSHITLGRVRSALKREKLVAVLKTLSLTQLKLRFKAQKLVLYKSTLTPQGPIYEVIHEANLKKI